jgi:hypothetical protein
MRYQCALTNMNRPFFIHQWSMIMNPILNYTKKMKDVML